MYRIINDNIAEPQADTVTLKKSLLFDFESNKFLIEDGSPVLSDDENTLINQWLEWLIRTAPAKYQMHSASWGVDTDTVIGGKITDKMLQIGKIEDSIRANLYSCPVILDVTNFKAVQNENELVIYFEITTQSGRKGVELAI